MDKGSVVVAVTGIAVSGVLGPLAVSRVSRGNERRAFTRARNRDQRDELRMVLDEAAVLVSEGPRVLRRNATEPSDSAQNAVSGWSDGIYPMRERLVLRLPVTHEVVIKYDAVRTAAASLAAQPIDDAVITAYERARDQFLNAARHVLDASIPEK